MKKTNRNSKALRRIIRRFNKNRATDAERDFLDAFERYQDKHAQAFEQLPADEQNRIRQTIWSGLQRQRTALVRPAARPSVRSVGWARRYAAVLMIGITAAAAIYLYLHQRPGDPSGAVVEGPIATGEDILPGGGQAVLRLADGRVVPLSEQKEGISFGERVSYLDGSALPEIRMGETEIVQSLILETPRGGTYQVTLDDGTQVWLNAASKLTYPNRFDSHERIVELEGEAYFDVARSDRPFLVRTADQTLEVLGTTFNVSAYTDDTQTTTTLVNGRVAVRDRHSTLSRTMRPGDQAILRDHTYGIQQVDVAGYIAWKDGLFSFNDAPLTEILGQLVRWYDFDLQTGAIPDLHFNGGIRRDVPLSHVLDMLESTTNAVHFEIDGRTLALRSGKR